MPAMFHVMLSVQLSRTAFSTEPPALSTSGSGPVNVRVASAPAPLTTFLKYRRPLDAVFIVYWRTSNGSTTAPVRVRTVSFGIVIVLMPSSPCAETSTLLSVVATV